MSRRSIRLSQGARAEFEGKDLVLMVRSAKGVPRKDRIGSCDPYLEVTLRGADGKDKAMQTWPYKPDTTSPFWNTARTFPAASHQDTLALKMWDHDKMSSPDYIGEGAVSVAALFASPDKLLASLSARSGAARCAGWLWRGKVVVELAVVRNPDAIAKKKKLFIVRHGESKWNEAQAEHNVYAMLSATDHPLNEDGVQQALELEGRVAKADDDGSPNEKAFTNAQLVLSSPLTRALQTALVGVRPVIAKLGAVRLMANAREKRNFGGRDSSGKAKGADIGPRAFKELAKVLGNDVQKYKGVKLDIGEVEKRWWLDNMENEEEVEARMKEFVNQLQFLREDAVIVVGHSHFFRELFKLHSHASFAAAKPDLHADLTTKKLCNCGVAVLDLDFEGAEGADGKVIRDAELLFGTQLVG